MKTSNLTKKVNSKSILAVAAISAFAVLAVPATGRHQHGPTDSLQDLTGTITASNKDKDGASQTANLGLAGNDLLQDTRANLGLVNQDKDGDKTQLGGLVQTQDYLDSLAGGVTGTTQQDGDTTDSGLNFKFE